VAVKELGNDAVGDARHVEPVFVGRQLRVERDLEQDVAELLLEFLAGFATIDRIEDLVGLFQQVHPQRLVGLLAIPRTSVVAAQPRHHESERPERRRASTCQISAVCSGQRIGRGGDPGCHVRAPAREFEDARRRGIRHECPPVAVGGRIVVEGACFNPGVAETCRERVIGTLEEDLLASAERIPLVERQCARLVRRDRYDEKRHVAIRLGKASA
jgi:hypothetical protein